MSNTSSATIPFALEAGTFALFACVFVCERLFSRVFKTSPLLGQLIAGIIVGPACLNIVPFSSAFRFLGNLGVMLLVVESGLDTDMERVVTYGPRGFAAALAGTVAPVGLAMAGAVFIFNASATTGLAAGSAIAPTSLGFSSKLLGPEGLKTRLGSIIAIAAVIDDVLSLCLLQIVRALPTAARPIDYALPVLASLGSIVGGVFVVHVVQTLKVAQRLAPKAKEGGGSGGGGSGGVLTALAVLVLAMAMSCTAVGSSSLLGCFLAGVAFSGDVPTRDAWSNNFGRLTKVGTSVFFAATIGFGVPSLVRQSEGGLFTVGAAAKGAWLLFAALVGKAFPLGLFASPLTALTFAKFAAAMQGRGEFSFLIADTALAEGALDNEWYSGCIWGVFLATLLAPFAFRWVLQMEENASAKKDDGDDGGGEQSVPNNSGDTVSIKGQLAADELSGIEYSI